MFESPLGLFKPEEDSDILKEEYGIAPRYLKGIMSPWAAKRLHEYGGDISKFRVVKLYPSILDQVAIAKTEPGDENNQDISSLVGKVDIRKLEDFLSMILMHTVSPVHSAEQTRGLWNS